MISFIVIGRNEEKNLRRCFNSIYNTILYNQINDHEVIFVDSKSTDRSVNIAEEFKEIKIYGISGCCNAAIGRNIGAKESKGSILFFIDGDMEIQKEFLREVLDEEMNLKYDVVSGQIYEIIDGIHDKLRYTFKKKAVTSIDYLVPGGIFLIRKNIWELVNGMRTKYNTGEDLELGYRILREGFEFIRRKEIITNHYTYANLDINRMWQGIFNKSAFYPRCVTYRDHFTNKYMYYGLWTLDKSFILLVFILFSMILMPKSIPYLVLVYFLAILIRCLKKVKDFSFIKYFLYYLFFDILNLIYLFTFFPKNKNLKYFVISDIEQKQT
ncbi:MAG: glycosyltransferase [Flavobacterium sp.]|nr:glycosyltransferase [Flavobacterium sp.]